MRAGTLPVKPTRLQLEAPSDSRGPRSGGEEANDLFSMLNMAYNLYSSGRLIKSERKMKFCCGAHSF